MSGSLCLTRRGFNFSLFYPGLQIEKRTARLPSGGWMLCCSAVTHHLPICRLCLTCDFFVISERVVLPLKYHSSGCRLSRRLWQMKKKRKKTTDGWTEKAMPAEGTRPRVKEKQTNCSQQLCFTPICPHHICWRMRRSTRQSCWR